MKPCEGSCVDRVGGRHAGVWLGLGLWCVLLVGALVGCSPTQGQCQGDGDCTPPQGFCVEGACVACRGAGDCASGQQCAQGSCTGGQSEPVAEATVEPKAEPSQNPDEPSTAPDDGGVSTPDEPAVEQDMPEPVVEGPTQEVAPEQPKVVKPPVLPVASNVCGSTKGCCVPDLFDRTLTPHTPRYQARSYWSVARWSPDEKRLVFVAGDSPQIFLRKGTKANAPYPQDKTLVGHTSGLLDVVFSPDGKYMATAGFDRAVSVWELSSGKRLYRMTGHGSTVYSLSFRSDSQQLASVGSYDRTVRIWDMNNGKLVRAIRTPDVVWAVAFSPDGKTLATGLNNRQIRLWKASDGSLVKTLSGHTQRVRAVAWSPDGRQIASGSDDNRVRLWSVASGNTIRTLSGHGGDIYAVAFSSDGKRLASGGTDRTARIWNVSNGQTTQTLSHIGFVNAVQWSADDKHLLTGSYAKELRIFEAGTGRQVRRMNFDESVRSVLAVNPNGKVMAHADVDQKDITVWQSAPRKLLYTLKGHTERVTSLSISKNGAYLVSASADQTARIWRLSDGKLRHELKRHIGMVYGAAIDPSATWVATVGRDDKVMLWQVADGKFVREADLGTDVRSVVWSPSGKQLAVGAGYSVRILQASDFKTVKTLTEPSGLVDALDWSKTTNRLVAGSWDRMLYYWNTLGWNLENSWTAHSYGVSSVAFSPDGKTVASVAVDNTVRLWIPETNERVHLLYGQVGPTSVAFGPAPHTMTTAGWDGSVRAWRLNDTSQVIQAGGAVTAVAVSHDNQWVAAAMKSGSVGVWRLRDRKKMGVFDAHDDVVRGVDFSPSGKWLATSSDDTTIKLWDVRAGTLARTLKGHIDRVYKVHFSADGKLLISASRDANVRIWDPATGKLVQRLEGAQGALIDVALSPDGKYVAAASFSGLVYVWTRADGKLYASLRGHLGGALSVVFRNNNELLSGSLDSRLRYWRLSDKRALRNVAGHNGPVFALAFRPDGSTFATASDDKTVRVWRASDGLLLNTGYGHTGPVHGVEVTSDNRWVSGSSDGTVRIWGSLQLRADAVQATHPFAVTSVTISRSGKLVLSTAGDRRTRLYRLSDYGLERTFYGATQIVRAGDISVDDKHVAFGGDDTYLRVYAVSNGALYANVKHDSGVTAVLYTADNKTLISGTEKGKVRLWDVAGKKFSQELPGHQGAVHTLAQDKAGKLLLTASQKGPIQLWQAADGKKLQTWSPTGDSTSAALSSNGAWVAAALASQQIVVWDAKSGQEKKILSVSQAILSVRFGGNGVWLAASLADGSIRLWDTKTFAPLGERRTQNLPLQGLATSADGAVMAAGDDTGALYFWRCR